ncbi:hypothetical protein CSC18_3982 [Klebsiella aerogenes]|nr:hypothetical protein CSC18_3982 [Klebsiella aerogenes]
MLCLDGYQYGNGVGRLSKLAAFTLRIHFCENAQCQAKSEQ